jgi:hypothetical protein
VFTTLEFNRIQQNSAEIRPPVKSNSRRSAQILEVALELLYFNENSSRILTRILTPELQLTPNIVILLTIATTNP